MPVQTRLILFRSDTEAMFSNLALFPLVLRDEAQGEPFDSCFVLLQAKLLLRHDLSLVVAHCVNLLSQLLKLLGSEGVQVLIDLDQAALNPSLS